MYYVRTPCYTFACLSLMNCFYLVVYTLPSTRGKVSGNPEQEH